MSIFKDSFNQSIRDQLATRQIAINNRTPQNLQYYNSRNAWIKLSSSVNVIKKNIVGTGPNGEITKDDLKNPANYDNTLANQYVLQGGILNNNQLRSGLGSDFSYAYSNTSANGEAYRLGIRPMPGITNVEIKSKGAYGSLREATVSFQCWDIKQLEDLEMLYMRQGYTVLLEWGWTPYLTNGTAGNNYTDNGFVTSIPISNIDIINHTPSKESIFKTIYSLSTDGKFSKTQSVRAYQGNYDAMFGTIKNYSWKARMDGGYDCQTTIISMGEVIESLKINYSPLDNNTSIKRNGLITPHITNYKDFKIEDMTDLEKMYSQNVLAGIFYEIREIMDQIVGGLGSWGNEESNGKSFKLVDGEYNSTYHLFRRTINIAGGEAAAKGTGTIGKSDEQIYITLESLCLLLNNYVLLSDTKNKKPFASLSVYERDASTLDGSTGEGYLLALAHPLQVSVDPTVCLIKNQLWIDGINVQTPTGSVDSSTGDPVIKFNHNLGSDAYVDSLVDTLIAIGVPTTGIGKRPELIEWITNKIQGPTGSRYEKDQVLENVRELASIYKIKYKNSNYKVKKPNQLDITKYDLTVDNKKVGVNISDAITGADPTTFYQLLEDDQAFNFDDKISLEIITPKGLDSAPYKEAANSDPASEELEKLKEKQEELNEKQKKAVEASQFMANLNKNYYINNDYSTELGIIGNIYVNMNMLYNMCVDESLASQDKKEKKEIVLYDYIKNILSKISSAIGEVNNFDIFVDPDSNVARIIDINYVDRMKPNDAYDKAFELQLHNLNSVVRSYSLESKIFPEQGTIIAIGAQVQGGALGTDTNTLTDFNRSIMDRIIPTKDAPTAPEEDDPNKKLTVLTDSLGTIYDYFTGLEPTWYGADGKFDVDEAGKYQGALRDIINFFKAISNSKTKNKAIIPTVLSIEMDGIGGIIIGNLFRIPSDLLPRGYKGVAQGGIGSKLGYIVTGLGHSIQNNDWVTKIEAQTIILDEPQGLDIPFGNMKITPPADPGTVTDPNTATSGPNTPSSGPVTINLTTSASGTVTSATITTSSKKGNCSNPEPLPNQSAAKPHLYKDINVGTKAGIKLNNIKSKSQEYIWNEYMPVLEKDFGYLSKGIKCLMVAQAIHEGFYPGARAYRTKNPGNIGNTDNGANKNLGNLSSGIKSQETYIREAANSSRKKGHHAFIKYDQPNYYSPELNKCVPGFSFTYDGTLGKYLLIYATGARINNNYLEGIMGFFKYNGIIVTANTTLNSIINFN